MGAFRIGETFKITGQDRHAVADALLVDTVALTDSTTIVDIGASDGSTSVDLIRRLPAFGSYVIADVSLFLTALTVGRSVLFYDQEDQCILIVGKRLVAWPTLSRSVRLLYGPLLRRAGPHRHEQRQVLMLNPTARSLHAADPRVDYRVHDVFQPWDGPKQPDVIKVANLLRRLYFDDDTLRRGLEAILESLPEGGHLLIVDNPRAKGVGPRAGIYQSIRGRFEPIAQTPDAPEIDDLIQAVGVGDTGTHIDLKQGDEALSRGLYQ